MRDKDCGKRNRDAIRGCHKFVAVRGILGGSAGGRFSGVSAVLKAKEYFGERRR